MMSLLRMALALLMVAVSQAFGQAYPSKPIRIISPVMGGVADFVLRPISAEINRRLGQPLVIESRLGASGAIAAEACSKSKPDGYTLCLLNPNIATFNPLFFAKLAYDADKDFDPIVQLIDMPTGILVPASLPVSSVGELLALARSKPGSLNYGSVGNGSEPHVFLEWLKKSMGLDIVHVPYKDALLMATGLVAGEIQLTRLALSSYLGQIRGGKLRLLAVDLPQRYELFPGVPTFTEVGLGEYTRLGVHPWFGLAAPTGTPKAIVTKLNAEIVDISKDAKFRAELASRGLVPAAGSPESFASFLKQDRDGAAYLIRMTKIRPD
jgi:tripartite-type tricarboxylate transporter receptor subunit TctC